MKRRLKRFVLAIRNLVNSLFQDIAAQGVLWYVNNVRVRAYVYAYGVGFSVVVWNKRQYQSLESRNSKIAVPLFYCMYVRG